MKHVDVFVTHAWRYHAEWLRFCDLFKNYDDAVIRNFSLPWHDPAYIPSTDLGKKHLLKSLETQILGVDIFFLLADLLKNKACLNWLSVQVNLAYKFDKPIFVVSQDTSCDDFGLIGLNDFHGMLDFSVEGLRGAIDKLGGKL